MLLKAGADPNHQCHWTDASGSLVMGGGMTSLIWTVHFGFEEMAALLLDHRADPRISSNHGTSVLSAALGNSTDQSSAAMAILLLSKGAEVPSSFMPAALTWATTNHHIGLTARLLEAVGVFDEFGLVAVTAITSNAKLDAKVHSAAAKALMSYYADIDASRFALLAARSLLQRPIRGLRIMIALSEEARRQAAEVPIT